MKMPSEGDWVEIAEGFKKRWLFPNCLGAVDGKHVAITTPANSESAYFNYKHTFSIVLMAIVDIEQTILVRYHGSGASLEFPRLPASSALVTSGFFLYSDVAWLLVEKVVVLATAARPASCGYLARQPYPWLSAVQR
ncbi:hypothetical protein V5799_025830 [Amblyomma americanum]|uniref:DDE Tnp4 domain-containing protein n=1 Tax=Amblyomma americanum TaxID=6943 RepID=A0AAQ4E878_AMBAM